MKKIFFCLSVLSCLAGFSQSETPSAFFSQTEMTPSGGQVYDEFYWLNSNNASLTINNVNFPVTGSYRCDISGYKDVGTPNISVSINGVVKGNISITSSTTGIFSVYFSYQGAGTYTVKLQLTNFNSAANYGKVGLVYFTPTSNRTPPVLTITPAPFTMGTTMLTSDHFASGHLRGFNLASNGYNQSNANGGNKQMMIDMVATGANIARCFVQIERPGAGYQFVAGELEKLDSTIARAARYGYYVVPCLFHDPSLNTDYWGNAARKTSIAHLWSTITNKYKNNKYVAGYDLINEPRQNFNYAEVIRFEKELIDTIRTVDANHVVMVECIDNDMFAMMLPLYQYTNVVYSPHGYSTLAITHQGVPGEGTVRNKYPTTTSTSNVTAPWGITQLSKQHDDVRTMTHRFNVPIFIGEFSCVNWSPLNDAGNWTSTTWVNDNISLLEAENWTWCYHAWRGDWPAWEAEIPSSYYNSFTFSNGAPQSLPSYGTWTAARSGTAPTIVMLEGWFRGNSVPFATTYYISNSGNDSLNGLSPATAWKTLPTSKIVAGSTYLFKGGETFYIPVNDIQTTTSVNRLTIGSYGTGHAKISGYSIINPSAWSLYSTNIWKVNIANSANVTGYVPTSGSVNIGFINVDRVRHGDKRAALNELVGQWQFFSDMASDILYVYSTANPSTLGTTIKVSNDARIVQPSNYTTIKNMDFEGTSRVVVNFDGLYGDSLYRCKILDGGGKALSFSDSTRAGAGIQIYNGGSDIWIGYDTVYQVYECAYTMQTFSGGNTPTAYIRDSILHCVSDSCESSWNPTMGVQGAPGLINCYVAYNKWQRDGRGWSHAVKPVDNQAVAMFRDFWDQDPSQTDVITEHDTIYNPLEGLYYNPENSFVEFTSRNNEIYLDSAIDIQKTSVFSSTDHFPYTVKDSTTFVSLSGKEVGSHWHCLDCAVLGTNTYYRDADGDGYGNPNVTTTGTVQPPGYVGNNTDCNDSDATINPNTKWYLDRDNDGYYTNVVIQCTSPGTGYYKTRTGGGDCNDNNSAIHPGATEVCDGIDNNCDGFIDESVKTIFYRDADGDGYGNASVSVQACTAPAGYVSNKTDCNDNSSSVHPGATEICGNGIDDNCDGQTDEGCVVTPQLFVADTTVNESALSVKVRVYLNRVSASAVSVNYTVLNGTATYPKDFKAVNGTLTIPAGSLSAWIKVNVVADHISEPTETFSMRISKPVNAAMSDNTGVISIINTP